MNNEFDNTDPVNHTEPENTSTERGTAGMEITRAITSRNLRNLRKRKRKNSLIREGWGVR